MKVDLIILLQQRNPILQRNTLGKINLKKKQQRSTMFSQANAGIIRIKSGTVVKAECVRSHSLRAAGARAGHPLPGDDHVRC